MDCFAPRNDGNKRKTVADIAAGGRCYSVR
jgi:hypothetical protein